MSKELSSHLLKSFEQAIESSFVEDSFVFNGKSVTLRSLSKEDYDSIAAEMALFDQKENEGRYITEYCIRHLYRSIVEFGGVNLRGVKYLQVEEGKPQVETHTFLKDRFLTKLSFEAFAVFWDKFSEVVEKAEKQQRAGISFQTPQERPDEKLTRLLSEASDLLPEVPEELVKRLLDKNGFPVSPSFDVIPDTDPQERIDTDPPPPPPEPVPVRDASVLPLRINTEVPSNLPPLVPSKKTLEQAALEDMAPLRTPAGQPQAVPVDRKPPQGINPRFQPPMKLKLVSRHVGYDLRRRRSTTGG